MERPVHKVTLSSGKVVILDEYKIKHQKMAAKAAALHAGDNLNVLAMYMGDELLKLLVLEIDGKVPEKSKLEDLDAFFTPAEYQELMKVVKEISGVGGEIPVPKFEIVSYGQR